MRGVWVSVKNPTFGKTAKTENSSTKIVWFVYSCQFPTSQILGGGWVLLDAQISCLRWGDSKLSRLGREVGRGFGLAAFAKVSLAVAAATTIATIPIPTRFAIFSTGTRAALGENTSG